MASVSVDVDLDAFDDDDVLARTLMIIKSGRFTKREAELVARIRLELNSQDDTLPPPSTAAKITTMTELKLLMMVERGQAT